MIGCNTIIMQSNTVSFVICFIIFTNQERVLGMEEIVVAVGFAKKFDCSPDIREMKCSTESGLEWHWNEKLLKENSDYMNYKIDKEGSLLIFSVGLQINDTIFSCRLKGPSGEICYHHQYHVIVDSCVTRTRGGVKSLCKFGTCSIEEKRNHSYFKCKCFRYYSGYFCDKSVSVDSLVEMSLVPWVPFFVILALAIIVWLITSFFSGLSKKERVFSKHKENPK